MQAQKKTLLKIVVTVGVIAACLVFLYFMKAEALAWHLWHQFKHPDPHGLDLTSYHVTVEAKPLANYKNASGLTFNSETGTLFTVLNDTGMIVEFSKEGVPIREIKMQGTEDLEGITHIEKDYYVVADERNNKLWLLRITPDTHEISLNDASLLKIGMHGSGNKNFEGVDWDSLHQRLIVVKERDPKYVMAISGFYHPDGDHKSAIEVERLKQYDPVLKWTLRDLSSVTYHNPSGHLFLLSDESKLLKQFDESGHTMGSLALWKGFHGLHKSVPQAEGVSIDDEGNIYIVSEPNLYYVFKPQPKHGIKPA